MKRNLLLFGAIVFWFAIILQGILAIQNSLFSPLKTAINFISYFTILTNTLCATYFTVILHGRPTGLKRFFNQAGRLTSLAVYISVVCLIYQFFLRGILNLHGWDRLADELLHSFNPLFFIFYWYKFEEKRDVQWKQLPRWLVYPAAYLVYSLIRGHFVGWYPYWFADAGVLGMSKVLINCFGVTCVFILFSAVYVALCKWSSKPTGV